MAGSHATCAGASSGYEKETNDETFNHGRMPDSQQKEIAHA
jgi:hypothetical protein